MPNIITHGLCAQDSLDLMNNSELKTLIQKNPRLFALGSNGPDFLFYYKALPTQNQTDAKKIHQIGNRVHEDKVNAFYQTAIEILQGESDAEKREILLVYLAGHLSHWALDSVAHPFIFNRSGELAGDTQYWHYRYESMLDTMMVKEVKGLKLSQVKSYEMVDSTRKERKVLADFYARTVKAVFGIDEDASVYEECFETAPKLAKLLYDPFTRKFPLVQAGEKAMGLFWKYSSHMIIGKIDAQHDVLNAGHAVWYHPEDEHEISTQSFLDLYEIGTERGREVLEAFNELVFEGKRKNLDDILLDRNYETGRSTVPKMTVYNSIYPVK